jgi:hypothetical protein
MVRGVINAGGSLIILAALVVWSLDQLPISPPDQAEPMGTPVPELISPALNLVQIQLPAPPQMPNASARSAVQSAEQSLNQPTGIHFRWPSAAGERSKLRAILHDCLGARMATLNKSGAIKQIENNQTLHGFSQFARLVKTPQNAADLAWLKKAAPTESVVRLIPASLDKPIFDFLQAKGASNQPFYLQGDLYLNRGKLMVTHLQLDETAYSNPIVLAQTRHCSSI